LANEKRSRRFLPGDPRVEEPYRLTPQLALRVAVLAFIALAVFAVLFLRLWALQVLSGSRYRAEANDNRVRTIQVDAPRGMIVDSSGRVLVANTLGTSLEVWPDDLPKSKGARLAELKRLSMVAAIPVKKIEAEIKPYMDNPLTPVVLRRGIHQDQFDYLEEHKLEFPGVEPADSYLRSYPHESLAAQLLGYVGPISAPELKAAEKEGYTAQDVIGQAGIEKSYDRYLKGKDGVAEFTVNSLGQPTSARVNSVLPQPGNTLRLTLNLRLQQAAERALKNGIALARKNGAPYADGGAIVALDPNTGAILAMASNPTYQPSVFVNRDASKLAPLLNPTVAAKDNHPALNRATEGVYPPGSTWKPVTALAAMEEGILSPTESLDCTPDFAYYQQIFKNWDPYVDQPMELTQALAQSCDTYFYRVGAEFYALSPKLGPTLQLWAERFGFGNNTGIDVGPESAGLVPTPDWRKRTFAGPQYNELDRTWKPGYEVQLAIGQGDLEVTPLQMARFYAMIANGGNLVTPHLAQDVEQPSEPGQPPEVLRVLATQQSTPSGVDLGYLEAVREGLYAGTHSVLGTSYGVFGQFPVPIAGKTGTAEKDVTLPGYPNPVKLSQSWWCGYGPYDKPTIVVCAVIENGGEGGSAAAPTALRVFESYFKKYNVQTTYHISD
jgi:penicillin-binding protein 2